MANNKVDLGCKQLRGTFQLSGKVSGRLSQNFYSEGTGSNGKAYRTVHFGVEVEQGKTVYIDLFGAVQDNCYISKRTTLAGGKIQNDTQSIPWSKRFDFEKDPKYKGYQMIGVTCGCKKIIDSKGVEKNEVKHITAFDACDEVQNLHDGDSVFIRGNIVYSTYNGQHRVKFDPTQISLRKPIDFDDMDFQPNAHFTQPLVLMGVEANKETGEFDVLAKIVNYNTIEDAEFHIKKEFSGLAKTLKKLGSYVHLKVFGRICVDGELVEEEVDDAWGVQTNVMERVASPFVRKLVIEGADKDSVDKEAYSKEIIEHAEEIAASIKSAKDDYGDSDDDWGNKKGTKSNDLDDDDDPDFDLGI